MMEHKNPALEKQSGFTRLELAACLCTAAVLVTVIMPAVANSGSRSDRVVCFNNLRQIGGAYGQFGLEHSELTPWRVTTAEGGNRDHSLKNNLSVQFSAVSNALATPKVLTDPADQRTGLRAANNWGTGQGGLISPAIGENAISYFIGVDGSFTLPRSVLAGDRNVSAVNGFSCSSGIVPISEVLRPFAWTNDVHGLAGNVVFFDGSAAQLDAAGLSSAFNGRAGDSRTHLLMP